MTNDDVVATKIQCIFIDDAKKLRVGDIIYDGDDFATGWSKDLLTVAVIVIQTRTISIRLWTDKALVVYYKKIISVHR